MADTPKKRTSSTKAASADKATTAKPRKTAAKKGASGASADPTSQNGHVTAKGQQSVSQEEVAKLAHTYWQQRGHKHGHHEEDWYRAEQELRGKVS